MTRDKRYYENRLNLLMAREKDNKRICNKIFRGKSEGNRKY